jgi:hypothetical protein
MPETPPPQNQITQFKLACAIGAIGGAIGLAGAFADIASALATVRPGEMWIKDLLWAASGATQAVMAVLLWKGIGWAFKRFAQASVVLSLFFLSHSMDCVALVNLVPLLLIVMVASPEQLPRTTPARIASARRNRRDRY